MLSQVMVGAVRRNLSPWFRAACLLNVLAVTVAGCEGVLGLDDARKRTSDVDPIPMSDAVASDAAVESSDAPNLINDPPYVVSSVSRHTCAVGADKRAFCWGDNADGQLGDGTTVSSDHPVLVAPFEDVVDVAAGYTHSCLVRANGDLYCWGKNDRGQLGDGTKTDRRSADRPSLNNVVKVGVAGYHTCAITAIRSVRCWGDNYYGALGDGTYVASARYVDVRGLSDVKSLAVGATHNCAATDQGKVYCWGRSIFGELGYMVDADAGSPDPNDPGSSLAQPVSGLTDVIEVAAGEDHTCAVRSNGQVVCWGRGDYGELGDPQKTSHTLPAVVAKLGYGIHLGAGAFTSCGSFTTSSTVRCWGQNNFGQLGTGNTNVGDGVPAPPVIGISNVFRMSTGEHSCAWQRDGKLFCWGRNDVGQLGLGRQSNQELLPQEVTLPKDAGP